MRNLWHRLGWRLDLILYLGGLVIFGLASPAWNVTPLGAEYHYIGDTIALAGILVTFAGVTSAGFRLIRSKILERWVENGLTWLIRKK